MRRDDGRCYEEFLTDLAKTSGIPTPTREDLARMDRKRKKKGSHADWYNPFDPEAKISKMKDGSTHLAHKEEHAVDMDTGAVVAVTLDGGTAGDTTTLEGTLAAAEQNLEDAREQESSGLALSPAKESIDNLRLLRKKVLFWLSPSE